jgi:hypothetical protein
MAITNALVKAGQKALTKGATKAVSKTAQKAITSAATKAANKAVNTALTKTMTGAGISTLAPKAGSTLDGILGRSSGIVLPEATKPVSTDLATKFAGSDLAKTAKQELTDISNRNNKLVTDLASDPDNMWWSNREIRDTTLGDYWGDKGVSKIGTGKPEQVLPAEYPEIGRLVDEGKLKAVRGTGNRKTKNYALTGDLTYKDKQDLVNAIKDVLPEGEAEGIALEPENLINKDQMRLIDQETAPVETKIEVSKPRTRAKKLDVSIAEKPERVVADAGAEVIEAPASTANPALANEIADMKARIGSQAGSGSGMNGNIGGGTTTAMPGSDGFNVKLKEGKTTNIELAPSAGSTRQQRAIRKLDDMTAKSMNANAKQYRGLVGKSGSIDGHYRTIAERMRAEKIDQANVAQKAQAALSLREDIKQQGLAYAEANGVTLDLSGIDNTIGMSATQKRKLAELGLSLDDMLGGNSVVSPTQAEEIYKTLRDYAYNWSDSKDAVTKMAGNACEKEAEAVRKLIDDTMDNINVDYKTSLVEKAAENGEDPAYLRKIAGKPDFKFSDLRKDQSDWIAMNDLAGNKIKEGPTLNVFGIDTGATNPFTAGAEKLKEKYYERQAYGAGGAGGYGGSGSVPPVGGAGAENNINFTGGSERTGMLGNLLGKAKGAGLVGAGVLGGLMLGGGGSSDSGSFDTPTSLGNTETAEPEIDPYTELTIGGYNYSALENGYMAALSAGDTDAAKLIANMMGMLDDKIKRYNDAKKAQKESSSGIAGKQKAALNVLSGLMSNYEAQGPISGRITGLLNTLTGGSYNPSVAAYDSGSAGALGTIIKALGDTGALSEGDQKRALNLLPKTTDSEAAAKAKYQQLIQILQGAGAQ